jgi:hypothetical protein
VEFMDYLFRSERPLIELIDSDVAFVNPLTAKYYPKDRGQMTKYHKPKGIEIEAVPNQKIQLKKTQERGGLLTIPGIVAMNKGPVLRGVWMLERVLGVPLPDPPMDVGQVPTNRSGETLSFRERFKMHRSKATCAVCHDKIDPLGFSMQGYDEKGNFVLTEKVVVENQTRFKTKKGEIIDASGQLPSGEGFDGFEGLKEILVTLHKESIIRNIVKQSMAYALCRKLEIYDKPTIDAIVTDMVETEGTYLELIQAIVLSLPFRETIIANEKS